MTEPPRHPDDLPPDDSAEDAAEDAAEDRPDEGPEDAPFVPRRRPFRKLFAWVILIGFGLTLLAMILVIIFG